MEINKTLSVLVYPVAPADGTGATLRFKFKIIIMEFVHTPHECKYHT